MLYTGFSEHELSRIIEILERHQVPFEVSADDQAIENAHALIASKFERGTHKKAEIDNSFYAISFERNELKNLSADEFVELKKLRIFAEHMAEPEPEVESTPERVMKPRNIRFVSSSPLTAVITISALLCLAWAFFNFRG